MDKQKVIDNYQKWCDSQGEDCPVICLHALTLLKEQEAQKFFVDESGKITPLPVVVRCKDCAHGSLWCGNIKCVKPGMKKYEMDLHPVNWFCADGEQKKGR